MQAVKLAADKALESFIKVDYIDLPQFAYIFWLLSRVNATRHVFRTI